MSLTKPLATALVEPCELTPSGKWVDVPGLAFTCNAVDACIVQIDYHLMILGLYTVMSRVLVDGAEPPVQGRVSKYIKTFGTLTSSAVAKLPAGPHQIAVQIRSDQENAKFKLEANGTYESHLILTPLTSS